MIEKQLIIDYMIINTEELIHSKNNNYEQSS